MPRDEAAEKCPDARRVAPIRGSVWCLLPDSSLCQNGKQVEIITKMIFELCYIEAITLFAPSDRRLYPYDYTMTRKSYANLEWHSKFA